MTRLDTSKLQQKLEETQSRLADLAIEKAQYERDAARSLADEAASKAEFAAALTAHGKRQIDLDSFPLVITKKGSGS